MLDYYFIREGNLEEPLCKEIIRRFEGDDRKEPGWINRGIHPEIKETVDLDITKHPEWKDIDNVLSSKLSDFLREYVNILQEKSYSFPLKNVFDTGFQVQRYSKGVGKYSWHHDYSTNGSYTRVFTYIWYLNNVDEGGETEFIDGTIVKPEVGKALLFPACWCNKHRGLTPISCDKYIVTGWVYSSVV